jgi:hypothetical protein
MATLNKSSNYPSGLSGLTKDGQSVTAASSDSGSVTTATLGNGSTSISLVGPAGQGDINVTAQKLTDGTQQSATNLICDASDAPNFLTPAQNLLYQGPAAGYSLLEGTGGTTPPLPPPADVVLIGHTAAFDNGSFAGVITTAPIETTGADFLVLVAAVADINPTVTDSFGNTWTAVPAVDHAWTGQLFYAANATVGTGHTFTVVQADEDVGCAVAAFSGVLASRPLESDLNGLGSTTLQFGAITPGRAGDLIVTGLNSFASSAAPSTDTGFTVTDSLFGTGNISSPTLAYLIAPTSDPVNPTWTNGGSWAGDEQLIGAIAVFAQA